MSEGIGTTKSFSASNNWKQRGVMLRPMNRKARTAMAALCAGSLFPVTGGCGKGGDPEGAGRADENQTPDALSVIMKTDKGEFEIQLRPDLAPLSVANFCNLVDRGFYHGKEISASNSVARTIGETGRIPDYQLPQEFSNTLYFDTSGIVAWTNRPREEFDPYESHPTRFFVTVAPQEQWNLQFTTFGTVVDGSDALRSSEVGDWIVSARVKGDAGWLYERYAEEMNGWNAALDAAGHTRAGSEIGTGIESPFSSN